MKLTNEQIYNLTLYLFREFKDNSLYLPIRINFYLQKNKNQLWFLTQDIESARLGIAKKYGKISKETNRYIIPEEKQDMAQKELNDLSKLEQEVQIYKIKLSDLSDDLKLTMGQMNALMFMIDEEE